MDFQKKTSFLVSWDLEFKAVMIFMKSHHYTWSNTVMKGESADMSFVSLKVLMSLKAFNQLMKCCA